MKQFHKQLRELHRHNPKEYWNILKTSDCSQKNEPEIPLSEYENFFRNLSQDNSSAENPEFDASEIDPSTIEEFNLNFTTEVSKEFTPFFVRIGSQTIQFDFENRTCPRRVGYMPYCTHI